MRNKIGHRFDIKINKYEKRNPSKLIQKATATTKQQSIYVIWNQYLGWIKFCKQNICWNFYNFKVCKKPHIAIQAFFDAKIVSLKKP